MGLPPNMDLRQGFTAKLPGLVGDLQKFEATPGHGRQPQPRDGRMNKLESAYAADMEILKRCGAIRDYRFGSLKVRLADRTWYKFDFLVWHLDGALEAVEVKGHWEPVSRAKFKIAAEQYPMFRWLAVMREGKSGWKEERL